MEPFIELEKSDFKGVSSELYRVPKHEDIVTRKSFVNVPDEKAEKMTIHEKAEYLRNKAVEFKKIVDRIGIRMAKTDYIIGTNPKTENPAIFGIAERVEGESLENMTLLSKEIAERVDSLYEKIISDLIESYLGYDYFWYDAKNPQFVFGKTVEDEKPDIYLVDVDPNIMKWGTPDLDPNEREAMFWNRLTMLENEIEKMEKKVDEKGFRLAKSRVAIKTAIEKFNSL